MTAIIRKNQEWLEKEIMEAIADELSNRIWEEAVHITEIVMNQLIYAGYAEHMNDDTYQQGKMTIEIDLPDPETCAKRLENLGCNLE